MRAPPPDPPVDAATAAALRRDVTIVVSPKDSFSMGPAHLEALRAFAPGVRVLHVLCGPMPAGIRAQLEARAGADPDLELIDSRSDFANPYALRNLALPRVRTKYVVFLFNDVSPRHPAWLAELYRWAEQRPEADLFQPLIWEGAERPHASWTSVRFLNHEGQLHCIHGHSAERMPAGDPAAQPVAEQPAFLEDHAFLARTSFLQAQSIMDPGGAYAKEFLDLALEARFRGARILSVPSAQVMYRLPFVLQPGDLLYFSHRRSWGISRGSVNYLETKWGMRYRDDSHNAEFLNQQLAGAAWGPGALPETPREQFEVLLGLSAAIGFDSFESPAQPGNPAGLPAFHAALAAACAGDGGAAIEWTMRRGPRIAEFSDFTGGMEARRRAVRGGGVFPVFTHPRSGEMVAALGPNLAPLPFAVVEFEGIRGDESDLIALFARHAVLLVRESDGAGQPSYRAWLHGVLQHASDVGRLAEALGPRNGGLRLGGVAIRASALRTYISHTAANPGLRVRVHASPDRWRLLYCAWRPMTVRDLVAQLR